MQETLQNPCNLPPMNAKSFLRFPPLAAGTNWSWAEDRHHHCWCRSCQSQRWNVSTGKPTAAYRVQYCDIYFSLISHVRSSCHMLRCTETLWNLDGFATPWRSAENIRRQTGDKSPSSCLPPKKGLPSEHSWKHHEWSIVPPSNGGWKIGLANLSKIACDDGSAMILPSLLHQI